MPSARHSSTNLSSLRPQCGAMVGPLCGRGHLGPLAVSDGTSSLPPRHEATGKGCQQHPAPLHLNPEPSQVGIGAGKDGSEEPCLGHRLGQVTALGLLCCPRPHCVLNLESPSPAETPPPPRCIFMVQPPCQGTGQERYKECAWGASTHYALCVAPRTPRCISCPHVRPHSMRVNHFGGYRGRVLERNSAGGRGKARLLLRSTRKNPGR